MKTPFLLLFAIVAPAVVAGQPHTSEESGKHWVAASPSRNELTSLEAHLERAVAEVSVPHAGLLLGRATASRGYRLPGYGIVFVLTPRALPGGQPAVYIFRGHAVPPGAPPGSHTVHDFTNPEDVELEALERQVLLLQHAAEAQRRAAEEDHERMVRDIRVRLAGPGGQDVVETTHALVVEEGAPPEDAPSDAPPPWSFWFDAEAPVEGRTPDRVLEDVRGAVIEALEAHGSDVTGLGAEEFVTVAVDFVPGGFFASHPRPTRTLIVRARQKDLVARAQGRIPADELRQRVEVMEY